MKNGAFAPKEQMLNAQFFHNIFKYRTFQRRQKALKWRIGLILKKKTHIYFAFVVNSYFDFKSTPILFIQIAKPG